MGWLRVRGTLVGGGRIKRVSGKVFYYTLAKEARHGQYRLFKEVINGKVPNHFNDNCKTTYNLADVLSQCHQLPSGGF